MKYVDPKALEELAVIDGPDLSVRDEKSAVREIILLFIEHSGIWCAQLVEAQASADAEKLSHTAHTFKSSSGYVGAHQLRSACEELETSAKTNNLEQNQRLIDEIHDLRTHVTAELNKYIGRG